MAMSDVIRGTGLRGVRVGIRLCYLLSGISTVILPHPGLRVKEPLESKIKLSDPRWAVFLGGSACFFV